MCNIQSDHVWFSNKLLFTVKLSTNGSRLHVEENLKFAIIFLTNLSFDFNELHV